MGNGRRSCALLVWQASGGGATSGELGKQVLGFDLVAQWASSRRRGEPLAGEKPKLGCSLRAAEIEPPQWIGSHQMGPLFEDGHMQTGRSTGCRARSLADSFLQFWQV